MVGAQQLLNSPYHLPSIFTCLLFHEWDLIMRWRCRVAVSNLGLKTSTLCIYISQIFAHVPIARSLEILTFSGNLHRSMIIYQMANVPLQLVPCKSLHAQQSRCLTSGWTGKWLIPSLQLTQSILKHPLSQAYQYFMEAMPIKNFSSPPSFHMTAPPLCDTQICKRWQDSRLYPLLSRGSWQHQMLPVTWNHCDKLHIKFKVKVNSQQMLQKPGISE